MLNRKKWWMSYKFDQKEVCGEEKQEDEKEGYGFSHTEQTNYSCTERKKVFAQLGQ